MNRIEKRFSELKEKKEKGLIVYITAGFPDLEATEDLAVEIASRGADIIELGIPFSDPLADGPTIQASSSASIERGTDLKGIFDTVRRIRERTDVPLVFMSYYNPLHSFGIERTLKHMKKFQVDGIIIPDLPPEESSEIKRLSKINGVSLILLAASNTPDSRLKIIAGRSEGFIYCLSHIGITGIRKGLPSGVKTFINKLRNLTDKPLAVGFGISEPEHVSMVNSFADAAIVGSAVIEVIKNNADNKDMVKITGDFVERLKSG